MRINDTSNDVEILVEMGKRMRNQRLLLGLTQAGLAVSAGVSKRTIERLESGASVQVSSLIRLFRSLGLTKHLDQTVPEIDEDRKELKNRQGVVRRRATSRTHRQPPVDLSEGEQDQNSPG